LRSVLSQLVKSQPHVSILLTSHNLNEVEELCDRVAVISRGSIRAVDSPKNLRARHKQTERVTIEMREISRREVEDALAVALGELEIKEQAGALFLSFTREANDERLDKALRLLAGRGASIVAINSEQATLLDVLLAYQEKEEAK
jgi:ABC-2 type transport system ATP-binding protein